MSSTEQPVIPGFPHRLMLASLTVLALGLVMVLVNWARIPDPIPVHFTSQGPDGWRRRSFWAATLLIWIGVLMVALFSATAAIGPAVRRPVAVDPARGGVPVPYSESLAGRLEYVMSRVSQSLGVLALLLSIGLSYAAVATVISGFEQHRTPALIGLLVGSIGGGLYVAVVSVRAISRAREHFPPDGAEQSRRAVEEDSSLYRWGMFYTNPADPMAGVHSRLNPDNMDFNYAHLPGKVFAGVVAAVLLGAVLLLVWTLL